MGLSGPEACALCQTLPISMKRIRRAASIRRRVQDLGETSSVRSVSDMGGEVVNPLVTGVVTVSRPVGGILLGVGVGECRVVWNGADLGICARSKGAGADNVAS
jgi:hypothetical protein